MKRYVIFHAAGVGFADGLYEVAEFVSHLDCRHYFLLDTLDSVSLFASMSRSLSAALEFESLDLSLDDEDTRSE